MTWSSIGTLETTTREIGAFDATQTYSQGDLVTHDGLAYICTASPTTVMQSVSDTFVRADQEGWGTASDGHTWTARPYAAGTATDWGTLAIVDDVGQLTGTDQDAAILTLGPALLSPDVDATVRVSVGEFPYINAALFLRVLDGDTGYEMGFCGQGNLTVTRHKVTDDDTSVQLSVTGPVLPGIDEPYWLRAQLEGTTYRLKAWPDGTTEPAEWTLEGADGSPLLAAGYAGLYLYGSGEDTINVDHVSASLLAPITPAPATDLEHWAVFAASAPGTPVLHGPYVVDYTDIPHDGDAVTLWTPQVGDVLVKLWTDLVTAIDGDLSGQLDVGTVAQPTLLAQSKSPESGELLEAPYVLSSTDPVQLRQSSGGDVASGHVEVYALVARAVAP